MVTFISFLFVGLLVYLCIKYTQYNKKYSNFEPWRTVRLLEQFESDYRNLHQSKNTDEDIAGKEEDIRRKVKRLTRTLDENHRRYWEQRFNYLLSTTNKNDRPSEEDRPPS